MRSKKTFFDILSLVVGSFLFGVGVRCFILPYAIVPGGTTGIAVMLNTLFSFPAGIVSAAVNIPLLVALYILDGRGGFFRALLGIVVSSLTVDLLVFLPPVDTSPFLAALGGSAVAAVGLAVALLRGFTSGGSDLAAHIIRLRYTGISIGRLVFLLDAGIILLSAVVLRNLGGVFYSVVSAVTFGVVLDLALAAFRRVFSTFAEQ